MLRPIAHFFLIGTALLGARIAVARLTPAPRVAIEVVVPDAADAGEVRRRTDDAILLEEALRFGWVATDRVVRRRLAVNMALANGTEVPSSDAVIDEDAVEQAITLGMHRTDPVVRGRLVGRVRQILEAPDPDEQPDDAALRAHLTRNAARFSPSSRVTIVHVAVRSDLHGPTTEADAAALLTRLREASLTDAEAAALGDPTPLLASRQHASIESLDRLFGAGFGGAVASMPVGAWSGPVRSSYGLHLVRVVSKDAVRTPDLSRIRARVLADYLASLAPRRAAARMSALRRRYDVHVVRARGLS